MCQIEQGFRYENPNLVIVVGVITTALRGITKLEQARLDECLLFWREQMVGIADPGVGEAAVHGFKLVAAG